MKTLIFSITLLLPSISFSASFPALELSKHFKGFDGCFVIKSLQTAKIRVFNEKRCYRPFVPCSTFKIYNSLVGLETGVISGKESVIKWNGEKQPYKVWEKDHTLETAIKYSVVPYYQEVARRVGLERMKKYMKREGYGNGEIGTVVDRFWLDGPLKVSAFSQVEFLDFLYTNRMRFSRKNMQIVREILVQDKSSKRVFSGKTGSKVKDGVGELGWFVGHVKSGDKEYVFATNIVGKGAKGSKAKEITKGILKEIVYE